MLAAMKSTSFPWVLALLCAINRATSTDITPVQQVLQMLAKMKAIGEKEMREEQLVYDEYKDWVKSLNIELAHEIKTGKETVDTKSAAIMKAKDDAKILGRKVEKLDKSIDSFQHEKQDEQAERAAQHDEFMDTQADYADSIDSLERAIQVMKTQNYDRAGAEEFLQKEAASKPVMLRVLGLMQLSNSQGDGSAPTADAYKFQSGGILAVLESLLKKFQMELEDIEQSEANKHSRHAQENLHMKASIKSMQGDRRQRASMRAQRKLDAKKHEGILLPAQEELDADRKQLADILATFDAKTAVFKANQEVRKQELEAIAKATEIISSPAVADSYKTHINLVQKQPLALMQLRMRGSLSLKATRNNAQHHAAKYLSAQAHALSSKTLALAAKQVSTGPFDKVIDMIKTLLTKLKEEAADEADHKEWCDEQLKTNKKKREKKASQTEKLLAEIEALSGTIASTNERIATLAEEMEDVTEAMKKATAQRQKENAENEATIADTKAGVQAVKRALVILKEFYSTQEDFIQKSTSARLVPEMEEYKGMKGAKGGVIGMMEVIETDFSRLLADTKAAESQAKAEYDEFMKDAKDSKQTKHKEEVKQKLGKDQDQFEVARLKKDLKGVQVEAKKANEYFETLKPTCMEVQVSYEERVARRKEEIAALEEAYKVLDSK